MTDNSDFTARYLAPGNVDRREPAARAPEDSADDVSILDPQIAEPGPAAHPRVELPKRFDFAPPPPSEDGPPAPGCGDEGAHARRLPAPPAAGQPDHAGPSPFDQVSVPPAARGHGGAFAPNGPVTASPAPIPPTPHLDPPAEPAQRWSPAVDPAERWAPRADPRGVATGQSRQIQVNEVVRKRRPPATMGWRRAVYASTGHVLNLGAGPHERKLRDWTAQIKANIPGNYQIATVSLKGGVGKTRITASLGTLFAKVRGEHVIAVDTDTSYGGLGPFVDPEQVKTVREYLADDHAVTHPLTRHYTGANGQGLEVLASHQNVASEFDFDDSALFATLGRTRRIFQLCLVDSADIEKDVFKAVLSTSDALMIVGSCNAAGLLAVEKTVDWLAARRGHDLLERSVIVLNDSQRSVKQKFVSHVAETVGKRVRAVKVLPWDKHLRDADTLDFPALRKATQLALMELAAELACGFPTAGALTAGAFTR